MVSRLIKNGNKRGSNAFRYRRISNHTELGRILNYVRMCLGWNYFWLEEIFFSAAKTSSFNRFYRKFQPAGFQTMEHLHQIRIQKSPSYSSYNFSNYENQSLIFPLIMHFKTLWQTNDFKTNFP